MREHLWIQLTERQVDGIYKRVGKPILAFGGDAIGIMNDHFMLLFSDESPEEEE